ncbi:fatty acid alpha-hydroxylase [Terramyces sp. JEL0728]|nr:fatty acid alpha-hydroxylase [Terramyces sp. JEL0728]KAJ3276562.1 fatty acid alpha-hydroxylase [Terramyces sp. JEL0728]
MTINIFSNEEVAAHHTTASVWVAISGKVYDITEFMEDHPGGDEILLQYGGKDITQVLQDPNEHLHSDSAYEMLTQYYIGDLEEGTNGNSTLKKEEKFIDVTKPMLYQVWTKKFSKKYYMEQIHIPRHTKGSAPIFGSFLEVFSKTPWYGVPIFWAPIITYCFSKSLAECSLNTVLSMFGVGLLIWTLIEYGLHRFIFHIDEYMPDHPAALTVHFLLHGVHHFLPMDRLRLVMPPALGFTLAYPFWTMFTTFLPYGLGQGVAAGAMSGFVMYDMCHYYVHHGKPRGSYFREMKSYHLDHHYKNPDLGFGITSKIWDYVFQTTL